MARLTFVRLDRFHVERLRQAVPHEFDLGKQGALDPTVWEQHHAEAALLAGEPVAAGGLIQRGVGRFYAWTLITPDLPDNCWAELARRFRGAIEDVLAAGARRIEAETHADWPPGVRLLEHCGFKAEGVLRCAMDDGGHALIFSRTAEDRPSGSLRYDTLLEMALRCWRSDVLDRWSVSAGQRLPGRPDTDIARSA